MDRPHTERSDCIPLCPTHCERTARQLAAKGISIALPGMVARIHRSESENFLASWRKLFATFSPLIGHDQVQILFMRSLDAGRHEIPWLPIVYPQGLCDRPLAVFESVSIRQSESQVQRAMRFLLSTYIDLLFALIGTTLTVQFVCNCAQNAPKTKYSSGCQPCQFHCRSGIIRG